MQSGEQLTKGEYWVRCSVGGITAMWNWCAVSGEYKI